MNFTKDIHRIIMCCLSTLSIIIPGNAQYRPIYVKDVVPNWHILHYDDDLMAIKDTGTVYAEFLMYSMRGSENYKYKDGKMYLLLPVSVRQDSLYMCLDVVDLQTGDLDLRYIEGWPHYERAIVPGGIHFDSDGGLSIYGYRDINQNNRTPYPMYLVGSIFHLIKWRIEEDTVYVSGPPPGDTSSEYYQVIWPFTVGGIAIQNDSVLLDIFATYNNRKKYNFTVFRKVDLEGRYIGQTDTIFYYYDTLEHTANKVGSSGGSILNDRFSNGDLMIANGWFLSDTARQYYEFMDSRRSRFTPEGDLVWTIRTDSFYHTYHNGLRITTNGLAAGAITEDDHYLIFLDETVTGNGFVGVHVFDGQGNWVRHLTSQPCAPNDTTCTSRFQPISGGYAHASAHPDGSGITIGYSYFIPEKGTINIFIDRMDNEGNRLASIHLESEEGIPLLLDELHYIDDDNILVNYHPRNYGKPLQSMSIPISAFSAVADKESPVELSVQAYPNPTTDLLYIESDRQDIAGVMIYDATGRQVMQVSEDQWSTGVVSTRHLTPGLYYLSIQYRQGSILSKPFMRQ